MKHSYSVICLTLAALCSFGVQAQGLKDATVALKSGSWKVLRSIDPMKDTVSCTGIYKNDFSVQLSPENLFITVSGGIQGVTLRFGDKPAKPMRLAEDMEKKIRAVIISGADFAELSGSGRLRYQVATLVSGVKTDEIDLTGFEEALDSIRSGCPVQAEAAPPQKPATVAGSLCTSALVERMRSQGLKDDKIQAICK